MSKSSDKQCDICGSPDFRVVLKINEAEIVKCRSCGLYFKLNRQDENAVIRAYAGNPSKEDNETVWLHSKTRLFNSGLRKINFLAKTKGKLLDVGCGHGYFIKLAHESGWNDVRGIELSRSAAAYAREKFGLNVSEKPLRENGFADSEFDCVTFWNVLNLLSHPAQDIKEAARILRPGGLLYARVSNAAFHVFWKNMERFTSKAGMFPGILHDFNFTSKSLALLIEKNGFEIVSLTNSMPTSGDAYGTSKYLKEGFVKALKTLVFCFSELLRIISLGHLYAGSALEVIAVKKPVKKKIAHVITRLDTGGSAENVLETSRLLNGEKYKTAIITGSGENRDKTLPPDISSFCKVVPSIVREISPVRDIRAFIELVKLFRNLMPDIVHTHSSKAGILGRWAARAAGIKKIVHTPHGHVFYGYYKGLPGRIKTLLFLLMEKAAAPVTTKLIALTEGEKKESLGFGIGRDSQWSVVHSGINYGEALSCAEPLDAGKKPDAPLVIGTVARLEPVKGVRYFIEAIPIIIFAGGLNPSTAQSVRFMIVGDGSERIELEEIVRRNNLSDKVTFTGMRSDIPELICSMDIYVQPSLNEGMGKTIVYAQMLGKPVVATRVQGIPDVVVDGETGILVPPGDAAALAQAIIKLIEDGALRKKMGEEAARRAKENIDGFPRFSSERMVSLLEKIYDDI